VKDSLARVVLVLVGLGLGLGAGLPARAASADLELPMAARRNWVQPLLPAVVSIATVKFVDDQPGKVPPRRIDGFGSGFIVDPAGTIVTNRHVVEGTTEIRVMLQDGTILPAKPIYMGAQIDLALLKVSSAKPLPTLKFGDSDHVQIGDPVAAIGNPLMLGGSVSSGIVSGLNRDIMSTAYDNFIQTDAAINHGNSGGPLVDMHGDVIGVNTAIFSPTATGGSIGIGFAAPANDAKFVVDQVRRYGTVHAGWLGINAQTVTPLIAQAVNLANARGAIVSGLSSKSPAAEAGLREGDVVLRVGAHDVSDSRALARMITETAPGQPLELQVWRDGRAQSFTATTAEWQNHPMRAVAGMRAAGVGGVSGSNNTPVVRLDTVDYGLKFGAITDDTRRRLHLDPGQKGAVVTEVGLNSPAADAEFKTGDLVLRVQVDAVEGPQNAKAMLDGALKQRRPAIIVLVQREDGLRWLPLLAYFSQG
jgi:serine protease Do